MPDEPKMPWDMQPEVETKAPFTAAKYAEQAVSREVQRVETETGEKRGTGKPFRRIIVGDIKHGPDE